MLRRRHGGREEPEQPGPLGRRGGGGRRYRMRQKLVAFSDDYWIENGLRQRNDVHVAGGEKMEVEGNILDHEYEIHEGRNKRAEISKK
jgi:uncharacterized protein YxjI